MIQPSKLRKDSLAWWKDQQLKSQLTKKHFGPFVNHYFLDGVQIEMMYLKETNIKELQS